MTPALMYLLFFVVMFGWWHLNAWLLDSDWAATWFFSFNGWLLVAVIGWAYLLVNGGGMAGHGGTAGNPYGGMGR
jgi:hypothetical protein